MSRMVRAGKFDKVITLQKRNIAKEPIIKTNDSIYAWEDFATIRASIEPLQGREYFSGPFQLGENIIRIRIRYIAGLNRKMRVKYGDRILQIYSVIDSQEKHKEIQLMCKEGEAHEY
ncbi:phage head closure protein [Otariodibacter oris]|nr:phage head closure protein [Otariodibacter oris]QGM80716.1 phage head-tail adapter protein [Otariodibacter oris]